jgi:hypothetical protein
MAVQKEILAISETGLKQSLGLLTAEQAMILETTEAFQNQMQAASERMSKSFVPTK